MRLRSLFRQTSAGVLLSLFVVVAMAQGLHRASHLCEHQTSHIASQHEQWLGGEHEYCALCDLSVLPVFHLSDPAEVKAPTLDQPHAEALGLVQPFQHRAAEYTALRGPPTQA